MTNVGVIGGFGRLGTLFCDHVRAHSQLQISALLAPKSKKNSIEPQFQTISEVFERSDIVVDMSSPDVFDGCLDACQRTKKPFISGTTGLSDAQKLAFESLSKNVPVLHASNFSQGMTVLAYIVHQTTKILGSDFDAEIYEAHHRHKRDAPSGSGLLLAETVAGARDVNLNDVMCADRTDRKSTRPEGEIGMAIVRGGGVFGEHSVNFLSDHESISLGHVAFERGAFANGALAATLWLLDMKTPGLYTMKDVLGLPESI